MSSIIITCNAGSSNIKLAVYDTGTLDEQQRMQVEKLEDALAWIDRLKDKKITCIGHRIVHGGEKFIEPEVISRDVMIELKKLTPLAPLHQPQALELIKAIHKSFPEVSQVGCFDTAFHRTVPQLEKMTALPREYFKMGIERYGFHGLSYQYIAEKLPQYDADAHKKRIIVAHLGGGSSICAMYKLQSLATTMGFSTLEGLMMGSRCGSLDPGIILYLLQNKKMKLSEVTDLLYNKSGLYGVSGISSDMQTLQKSKLPEAKTAIDLYCYMAAKQLGSLIAVSEGMDILVFTGGIGENSPEIRRQICSYLQWMGVRLDKDKNRDNGEYISSADSQVEVCVIPTDEEKIIAQLTSAAICY